MNKAKAEFAERLRQAMLARGYDPKPAVLEKEFNQRYWGKAVTLHGVRRWLRGETFPSNDKMQVLAEWLQLLPHELRDGSEISHRISQRQKRWEEEIGYAEREVFEAYLKLPVAHRKIVREVILAFLRSKPETGQRS
jgi:hypothetical protein